MIFDGTERRDDSFAGYAEPPFVFLNRSARFEVGRIRTILEEWFANYPSNARDDLRARFRSPIDIQHHGAFFELFLHELLLRLGCRVIAQPKGADGNRRMPDFLVRSATGKKWYLEATVVSGESRDQAAARARINTVYDALNRVLDSPNFFIGLELRGAPRGQPPARKIQTFLTARLSALDPDSLGDMFAKRGFGALPRWRYEYEGWRVDFFPIPKSPKARNKTGVRPLGSWWSGVRWVDTLTPLRKNLKNKAGRYGDLDAPYVIAVNQLGNFADRTDAMEALFGTEEYLYSQTFSGRSSGPTSRRAPDGLWVGKSGPINTRVSAVMAVQRLYPWNVSSVLVRLWLNPWPKRSYTGELTCLPRAVPDAGRMRAEEGASLENLFDMPRGWPFA